MKIGVLGGSFNPITNGHLQIIKTALNYFDQVWIAPSTIHQSNKALVDDEYRLQMCQLAVKDFPRTHVSDYQLLWNRDNHSGAWFKMIMAPENQKHQFYFIMGTDVANAIYSWDNYPKILEQLNCAIVTRKGYPNQIRWQLPHLFIDANIEQISSTDWRKLYKIDKEGSKLLIPNCVFDYIVAKQLY